MKTKMLTLTILAAVTVFAGTVDFGSIWMEYDNVAYSTPDPERDTRITRPIDFESAISDEFNSTPDPERDTRITRPIDFESAISDEFNSTPDPERDTRITRPIDFESAISDEFNSTPDPERDTRITRPIDFESAISDEFNSTPDPERDTRITRPAPLSDYTCEEALNKHLLIKTFSDNTYMYFTNNILKGFSNSGSINVSIYDVNGRCVKHFDYSSDNFTWNAESMNSGVYFAVLNNNEFSCKMNIIK